jgi:hypothetical protein
MATTSNTSETSERSVPSAGARNERLLSSLRVMVHLAERYGAGLDCDGNLIEARELIYDNDDHRSYRGRTERRGLCLFSHGRMTKTVIRDAWFNGDYERHGLESVSNVLQTLRNRENGRAAFAAVVLKSLPSPRPFDLKAHVEVRDSAGQLVSSWDKRGYLDTPSRKAGESAPSNTSANSDPLPSAPETAGPTKSA